ncbi:thioesterase-like superfamily-domain-containing protein [Immersiella caudata]|uniref:Thioesterase-like superfamily-domain-containing protein n=1 Tax=Immersiella caudata TaxID=314043 RepID=A0AA39WD68_9PEZI|nr:thioesterase-like superfamily-domain-containing protein [Immersiella caudata]
MPPTLFPPPPVDPSCAPIEHTLLVIRAPTEGQDVFTNTYPLWIPPLGRSLFGGVLIGQAISAAQHTVKPDFVISRMSCTFLATVDTTKPLYYRVSRSSDRSSTAVREVKVEQDGIVSFTAECNFSRTAPRPLPAIHQPVPLLSGSRPPPAPGIPESNDRAFTDRMDMDPFLWEDLPPVQDPSISPPTNALLSWTRTRGAMSLTRTNHNHLAVLGFLTDSWNLSRTPEMHPAALGPTGEKIRFIVTLNHTIWFHDPLVKMDDWLLVSKGSSWAAEGRCLVDQRVWDTRRGTLVATCVQEGALRVGGGGSGNGSMKSRSSRI